MIISFSRTDNFFDVDNSIYCDPGQLQSSLFVAIYDSLSSFTTVVHPLDLEIE